MRKVLATLLIATVSLSTLLANGITEGTISESTTIPQEVETTTYDESLELEVEETTNIENTLYTQRRGPQSTRNNANRVLATNQNVRMHQSNRMTTLPMQNTGGRIVNKNVNLASNYANRNSSKATRSMNNKRPQVNMPQNISNKSIQRNNYQSINNMKDNSSKKSNPRGMTKVTTFKQSSNIEECPNLNVECTNQQNRYLYGENGSNVKSDDSSVRQNRLNQRREQPRNIVNNQNIDDSENLS